VTFIELARDHAGMKDFQAAFCRAVGARPQISTVRSFHVLVRAVTSALTQTQISPSM
jgi:hypothetical protein